MMKYLKLLLLSPLLLMGCGSWLGNDIHCLQIRFPSYYKMPSNISVWVYQNDYKAYNLFPDGETYQTLYLGDEDSTDLYLHLRVNGKVVSKFKIGDLGESLILNCHIINKSLLDCKRG